METAIFYPGAKNDTVQRVMYIERPHVAEKWVYLTVKRTLDTCFGILTTYYGVSIKCIT